MEAINHFLVKIPGPFFLLYYTLWAIALFVFFKIIYLKYISGRHTENFVTPSLSAIELVVLNNLGSRINMLKAIIASLWYKKVLVLNENGTLSKNTNPCNSYLSRLESKVASFFKSSRSLKQIFRDKKFLKDFSNALDEIYESLRAKQMIKPVAQYRIEKLVYFIVLFLLLFPAILKFRLGIIYNRPVVFLMVLMIVYFVVFLAISPSKKTIFVRRTIKKYQENYKQDNLDFSKPAAYDKHIDPLLYAGIFGVGALFLFPEFGALQRVFPTISSTSSGCSGCSAGSGCSSCGGCGGGCGGCGGGGD